MFQVKTKSGLHPTAKVKTRVPWIPPGKASTRETSYKWEVSQILQIYLSHCGGCNFDVFYGRKPFSVISDVLMFMYVLGTDSSSGDNASTGT